jgi:hypothetical protein
MSNYLTVNLQIKWIRHGYSCANYLYDTHQSGVKSYFTNMVTKFQLGDNRGLLAPDAKLTDATIKNICNMKNKPLDPNTDIKYNNILDSQYFFCSELTRAVETAILLFGSISNPIYVIPFVGEEKGSSLLGDKDNLPSDIPILNRNIEELKEYYSDKCQKMNKNVSLDIIKKYRGEYGKPTLPSLEDFLDRFIPNFIKDNNLFQQDRQSENPLNVLNLKISIVSHSHFIKKITGIKVNNLDVVLQKISAKYNIINKNGDLNYVLQLQHGKDYFIPILEGPNPSNYEHEKYNCIETVNSQSGSCKYSYTKYGTRQKENGILEINTDDDIQRCNFPSNIHGPVLSGGAIYRLKNI